MHDAIYNAFTSKGIDPPKTITLDGEFHRFSTNGEPADLAGWYVGDEEDGVIHVCFGDWRTNKSFSWSNRQSFKHRCNKFKKVGEIGVRWEEKKKFRSQQNLAAAKEAARIWKNSAPVNDEHPYLQAKSIAPCGVRVTAENRLVVPVLSKNFQIKSIQYIQPDGSKRFLKNGQIAGGFFWIGPRISKVPAEIILVCEGFATGATLHEATGISVLVAFNANNLLPASLVVRACLGKRSKLVICGDDDRYSRKNVGREKAESAAEELGARLAFPNWPPSSDSGTDFNDLAQQIGKPAVSAQVAAALQQPAAVAPYWWITNSRSTTKFSSQFAAEAWVQSRNHRFCQDGSLWQFNDKVWEPFDDNSARREIRDLATRGKGGAEGLLRFSHVEDTFAQAKVILGRRERIVFDNNPSVLVFQNGTLHLNSGFEENFDPNDFASIIRSFDYAPTATCPLWENFLSELHLQNDAILRLQEWFGYCLVPVTRVQKALMLVGEGDNGKSVFLGTLRAILNNQNVSSLELCEMEQPFKVGMLQGKLANICPDQNQLQAFPAVFKKIVSGEPLTGEKKFQNPFEFAPFAKLVLSLNRLPNTLDSSHGFFRRIDVVRFTRIFSKFEQDPQLDEKLLHELPGIFNWALRGLMRLIKANWRMTESSSMKEELSLFRSESNPIIAYLEECCSLGEGSVEKQRIIRSFSSWCEQNNFQKRSAKSITRELSALGVKLVKKRNGPGGYDYVGLKLIL